jgi:hypothetical protein
MSDKFKSRAKFYSFGAEICAFVLEMRGSLAPIMAWQTTNMSQSAMAHLFWGGDF